MGDNIWDGVWITNFIETTRPNPGAVAYRYRDQAGTHWGTTVTGDYEATGTYYEIVLDTFRVTRFSPKGYFIEMERGKEKFIAHSWRKKFAHLNHAEAREAFRLRKLNQQRILQRQLKQVSHVLESIENGHWAGRCPSTFFKLPSRTGKQEAS